MFRACLVAGMTSAMVPLTARRVCRRSLSALRAEAPSVEAQLKDQLGYVPPNLLRVAAWTGNATPAVIQAHPLLRRRKGVEPFPTMFWLTFLRGATSLLQREHPPSKRERERGLS